MYPKEWRRKSHPRILYTVNLSFKKEDKIWIFLEKGGKKEFEELFIWASRSETLKLVFLDLKQVMKDSNTHGEKRSIEKVISDYKRVYFHLFFFLF